MAVTKTQAGATYGEYEPWLDYQFLPGCRECGGSHPLARKPVPLNTEVCPDCNATAGTPGEVKTEWAAFKFDPVVLYGRFCLWVGRKLGALYERL